MKLICDDIDIYVFCLPFLLDIIAVFHDYILYLSMALPYNSRVMSEVVDQSLRKIARGSVLIFIGTGVGMFLGLIGRIIVAKYVTQEEYGIFSLALVIVNVLIPVFMLGLDSSSTRQIAFYRGKGDEARARGITLASLRLATVFSVSLSALLFFMSDIVSIEIFHNPDLSMPLRIFSITIPFFVLIDILTSIFRAFNIAEPGMIFQNILKNFLFPLLLVVVILLSLPFISVVYAFMASIVLTFLVFALYTIKKTPVALKGTKSHFIGPEGKELLLFSLPLFAHSVLGSIIVWIDTLALGFFKTSADVGLYNAALPLANLLLMVLTAASFLYLPLMSQLYARKQIEEIRRSYIVINKWIFAATLPIFLIFMLFPEASLNIVFGIKYSGAAPALQILALGFFIHNILACSGYTLLGIGEARFLMWSGFVAVIISIVLNVILIPIFGIVGAAIATATTRISIGLLWSIRFNSLYRVLPFTKNYLKPALSSIAIATAIYVLVKNFISPVPFWLIPILFLLFIGVYALSVLFTKSFDKEDIMMLNTLEKKLGLDLEVVKKILKKFT